MLSIRTAPGSGATGRRNIKSRCILFSLLFFISSSGLNAAPGDSTITLTNAVQRALSQNPSLKVFPYRYAALQGQAETAGLRPAYELGFDAENVGGTGTSAAQVVLNSPLRCLRSSKWGISARHGKA